MLHASRPDASQSYHSHPRSIIIINPHTAVSKHRTRTSAYTLTQLVALLRRVAALLRRLRHVARPDVGIDREREDLPTVALLTRERRGVGHHLRRRRR